MLIQETKQLRLYLLLYNKILKIHILKLIKICLNYQIKTIHIKT